MANNTRIEWTETTWNPVTGCTKISDGCINCYAKRMAIRLQAMRSSKYVDGFEVAIHPQEITKPYSWKNPRIVFVNSMGDLFHQKVPLEFIKLVFETIRKTPQHTYQVLTKRSDRLATIAPMLEWPENLWMGVTVESHNYLSRVNDLNSVPSVVRFLSCEPLLGSIKEINLECIDWVIVGGESGPGSRTIEIEWVREVRDLCINKHIPFFFKQWGGTNKKKKGRLLDGVEWVEYPCRVDVMKESSR